MLTRRDVRNWMGSTWQGENENKNACVFVRVYAIHDEYHK